MYSPAEVARHYVETGKSKAALPAGRMLLLGMLAGAFIALAGGSATFAVSYGGRLAGAAVFPAGLAMVLLAGSELFTGNCLLVIPLLESSRSARPFSMVSAFSSLREMVRSAWVSSVVCLVSMGSRESWMPKPMRSRAVPVSYTHLTLPTTPYV